VRDYLRFLALAAFLGASCVAGRVPPSRRPESAVAAGALPIAVADEVARFTTATIPGNAISFGDGGDLVLAEGSTSEAGIAGSAVVALSPDLQVRWRTPVEAGIDAVLALGDGRALVAVSTDSGKDDELRLLDSAGRVQQRTSLSQLLGAPCRLGSVPGLVRDRGAIMAGVSCKTRTTVRIASDLSSATPVGSGAQAVAPRWGVEQSPTQLAIVRGSVHVVLTTDSARSIHGFALAGYPTTGDIVAAASVRDESSDVALPYTSHGVVVRAGRRLQWQRDLRLPPSADPIHIQGVVAGDGLDDVLVLVDYGHDGRILDTDIPPVPPVQPDHPAFPDATHGLAWIELAAGDGAPRRIVALRMRTPMMHASRLSPPALAASRDAAAVAGDGAIVLFRRGGHAIAPGVVSPVRAAPVPAPVPALEPSRVVALEERWSEVCGPRSRPPGNAPCRIEHVALGRDGTVVAGGGYYGANQLGTHHLASAAYETGLLAVYAPDGRLRWHKTFGASWHNSIERVLARDDGSIVVLGYHGQGFAIDGVRLPDRELPMVEGEKLGFRALIGFVAVFDRTGKLALLEDVDALAYGDHSSSVDRSCRGELAPGHADDETWLLAQCNDDAFRLHLQGTAVGPARPLGTLGRMRVLWNIDATGQAIAALPTDGIDALAYDGDRAIRAPIVRGDSFTYMRHTAGASGAWFAAVLWRGRATTHDQLVVANVDPAGKARAVELATATGGNVTALTVDDEGRPVIALGYEHSITIAGQRLEPEVVRQSAHGLALVRLTRDGSAIDRVIVPHHATRSCTDASHGTVTAIAARGERIALTFGFGVDPACAKDEPSTVMVLAP
jgi:hypothetical protein